MQLREQTQVTLEAIDTEAGVVRGVRILGPESKNGRRYSPAAINAAAKLYEGTPVNVDHSRESTDRPVADAFGWLKGVEVREGAVFGDLHYLRSHPQAPLLIEVAQRNPNRLGLSHHAEGTVRMDGGKTIVETVERVHSVDLVQTPATNAGLFESEGAMQDGEKKMPMMEEFRAKVMEAMDGEGDMAAKIEALKQILAAMEAPAEPASPEIEVEMGEGEKPMAESLGKVMSKLDQLLEGFGAIKADHDARALLESSGREVTRERVAALLAVDAGKRSALLESWPVSSRAARPAVSPPASVGVYPQDTRGFLAAIRN